MASTADLVADSTPDLRHGDTSFWKKSFKQKLHYIKEVITVEPLITSYIVAAYICSPALRNLEFEKACRVNLQFNDTICEAVLSGNHENYTSYNDKVLVAVSNLHSWQIPVESIMPLILILFLGSYSDRHKLRKPFLLFPIIGEFFSIAACILCVVFMDTWSLEVLGVARAVIPSMFGGQAMIVMAVFSYIADVSTVEMRTLRMGVVQITLNIFSPIIQSISGILFQEIGYYGVLFISCGFYVFSLVYGIFCIKEPKQPVKGNTNLILDIFDPRHAIETFNLMFKKSPENKRIYIMLVLVTIFVYNGVSGGELNLYFSYVQRQLGWTVVDFSYLISVNTVVHLIGTTVTLPIFTKWMNLSDPIIIVVTFLDKIICNVIFSVAYVSSLMYVAVITSFTTGVSGIAIRSLGTKVVSVNDLGKAQSLFSIFEAIAPAVLTPIYNQVIYNNTFDVFPPAFFLFGIILYVASCILVMWMWLNERIANRKVKQPTDKAPPTESYMQTTHI